MSVISVEQVYAHAPAAVWRALTTPELHARWWAAGDVRPIVGHRFTLDMGKWGQQPCEVLAVETERLLSYKFATGSLDTTVTWRLTPEGSGTRLSLTHEGLSLDSPMGRAAFEGMKAGWPAVLGRLADILGGDRSSSDTRFAGSIPATYDEIMGPLFFEPYAEDLTARVRDLGAITRVLETAAGTGIVTRALSRALPEMTVVATDLNDAMLQVASAKLPSSRVSWKQADAQALPFGDAEFDAVVCQFGLMFFPDKPAGLRQARRVLRPSGHLLFNVWDRLDRNPVSQAVGEAVATKFPDDPPAFLSRGPFSWHDAEEIRREVQAAGFSHVLVQTVEKVTISSARNVAEGLCKGSPLRNEIEARAPERLDAITSAVADALTKRFGAAPFENHMSALVVTARA
jgi:ubiquinone/menaquinone biosynthesis C-methylase UbiE/uncharacterized protein YndB with AHSA1/START domain